MAFITVPAAGRVAPADPVAALRAVPRGDAPAIYRAALLAIQAGHDEAVLPIVARAAARHPRDLRLAQLEGLAARTIGDLKTAVAAFGRAACLAPTDPLIVHSLARSRLEAGLPAVDDFARARRLAPNDAGVIQGQVAARFASDDAAGADAELAAVVRANPGWREGHSGLVRLRRMAGDPDLLRSFDEALAVTPRDAQLWLGLCDTLIQAERYAEVPAVLARLRGQVAADPVFDLFEAVAADELGDTPRAAALFAQLPAPRDTGAIAWHVRHLFRTGRPDAAAALAERGVGLPGGRTLWPYLALAWRLLADPRWQWLEGDERFVRVVDLPGLDLAALATRLRALHLAREQPLDQSVRGGTQTDGPLFSRIDPEIVALVAAVRRAVADYVAALPPPDPRHPLLGPRRAPLRFAGSWSVRLTDGGYHADHVHPQGWISSALYIALPEAGARTGQQGWLTLGAARTLVPDLPPFRTIEPAPGRLVLFPSTMWHGTLPFPRGERLTTAFDVALRD